MNQHRQAQGIKTQQQKWGIFRSLALKIELCENCVKAKQSRQEKKEQESAGEAAGGFVDEGHTRKEVFRVAEKGKTRPGQNGNREEIWWKGGPPFFLPRASSGQGISLKSHSFGPGASHFPLDCRLQIVTRQRPPRGPRAAGWQTRFLA